MLNKLYDKIKEFISETYKSLIVFIVLLLISTIELPYYVNTPGGVASVKDKILINGEKLDNNYFNLAYVLELKGTLPNLLIAKFNSDWDIVKKESEIASNESEEDSYFRDHLLLEEANQNAIILAYTLANKEVNIKSRQMFITYIDEDADTDLKIGDEIIKINDTIVTSKDDLVKAIDKANFNDKLNIVVKNDDKESNKYAVVRNLDGLKKIGLLLSEKREIETDPSISLTFKSSESGPSGGLMMSLAIYDALTGNNLTNGNKIAGTGTIDLDGNVGSIGGVEYKLKGVIKAKIKTFLVPSGENYEEALKIKEQNNYDINIIPISNIKEAINYLNNLK